MFAIKLANNVGRRVFDHNHRWRILSLDLYAPIRSAAILDIGDQNGGQCLCMTDDLELFAIGDWGLEQWMVGELKVSQQETRDLSIGA